MIHKLMQHITKQSTMIGHKIWFIILALPFFLTGCPLEWDEVSDYNYLIKIKNSTNDTIVITNNNGGFINYNDIKEQIIYPDSTIINGTIGIMKGENAVKQLFLEWSRLDSFWVFRYDSFLKNIVEQEYNPTNGLIVPNRSNLLVVWESPAREMPVTTHHFFNYNSWESWLEKGAGYDGIVQFTIYETDITGNTK